MLRSLPRTQLEVNLLGGARASLLSLWPLRSLERCSGDWAQIATRCSLEKLY